tara:strand:+ start:447 stop:1124 length:678 start_codon:yes stop_codon:yes gene_type:complete
MKHYVKNLSEEQVVIDVYGCGGTGSHVLNGLARISKALADLGHPGIHVMAYDPDEVTHDNVGRQAFYEADVGHNKAKVLVDRINLYYMQRWGSKPFKAPTSGSRADIVISCVDTKRSRKAIAKARLKKEAYVIDCGNEKTTGQVIMGQYQGELPSPYEENEELVTGEESEEPGCIDQYYRQDLFINSMVANYALHLVWNLFRKPELEVRGMFMDIGRGITNPIKC